MGNRDDTQVESESGGLDKSALDDALTNSQTSCRLAASSGARTPSLGVDPGICTVDGLTTTRPAPARRSSRAAWRTQRVPRAPADREGVIQLVARRLGETLGETCLIRMAPKDGDYFEKVEGIYHPDPAFLEEWREHLRLHPQRIDEGITGKTLSTGKSALVPSTTPAELGVEMNRHRTIIERLAVHSLMTVPLFSEDR